MWYRDRQIVHWERHRWHYISVGKGELAINGAKTTALYLRGKEIRALLHIIPKYKSQIY